MISSHLTPLAVDRVPIFIGDAQSASPSKRVLLVITAACYEFLPSFIYRPKSTTKYKAMALVCNQ